MCNGIKQRKGFANVEAVLILLVFLAVGYGIHSYAQGQARLRQAERELRLEAMRIEDERHKQRLAFEKEEAEIAHERKLIEMRLAWESELLKWAELEERRKQNEQAMQAMYQERAEQEVRNRQTIEAWCYCFPEVSIIC